MGTSSSKYGDITTNEYLQRFVGHENISPNDPFWNRFLSFSYTPPVSSFNNQVLDERIQPLCKQLVTNNPRSGNVGSLLHVFLSRSSELLASTQTENSMFSWQTYNALFILRCVTKYLIESIKEEDVIRQFEAQPQEQDGLKQTDEHVSRVEIFLDSLIEIIVDVPVKDFTYPLHLEAINCLLILLSVQMFTQKPAARSFIYRSLMQGRYSIHAPLLVKKLLQHFINQEKAPPGLYNSSGGGSLVVTLASELWSMITWGLSRASSSNENAETPVARPVDVVAPLANQSVLLILVLANHCTSDTNLHNPYCQALFSFRNSSDGGDNSSTPTRAACSSTPTSVASTFKIDMSQLYRTLCTAVNTDQTTLLLYLLIHRNYHVRTYILACSDIEQLVIPILKTLYHAPNGNSHHIYMSLIILLILSEDDLFNKTVHEIVLRGVSWYTERSISEISLGGLLVLVIIRTIQYNMLKIRDKYLHTNCLAALANMSSQFRNLHPYVTQRLVSLFETLAKKHMRLEEQLNRKTSDIAVNVDDDATVDLAQDVSVLEEVLRMILEVLNSCLSHQLAHNSNLIYTLLYQKHVFESYRSHQAFQDVVRNIDTVITYFSRKLNQVQKHLSVTEVQETIQQGALEWNKDKLRKFADLKFKYVEEDQPEDFFIPYVWTLVSHTSGLHWNPANNKLFVPDLLNVVI